MTSLANTKAIVLVQVRVRYLMTVFRKSESIENLLYRCWICGLG